MQRFKILLFVFIVAISKQSAFCWSDWCGINSWLLPSCNGHQFYVGPEVYHVTRKREGGTRQHGYAVGGRVGYDYIEPFKLYLGADGLYASGRLKGHSGSDETIKSEYSDAAIEGRIGYNFQQTCGYRFGFIPFAGAGYLRENNNFISPSPLRVHFHTYFTYFVGGFLSQISLNPCFDIGLNFKVRYLFDARVRVTHDPDFDTFTMLIKNRNHYRAELPLTYHLSEQNWISLVPFYELRRYGGQPNFPFDFLETKLNIYGATLKLMYCL